jgi:hypothetical protein
VLPWELKPKFRAKAAIKQRAASTPENRLTNLEPKKQTLRVGEDANNVMVRRELITMMSSLFILVLIYLRYKIHNAIL